MCIRDSREDVEIATDQQTACVVRALGTGLDELLQLLTPWGCLLYTSDAADERSSVDLGGRRIIKKKKSQLDSVLSSLVAHN